MDRVISEGARSDAPPERLHRRRRAEPPRASYHAPRSAIDSRDGEILSGVTAIRIGWKPSSRLQPSWSTTARSEPRRLGRDTARVGGASRATAAATAPVAVDARLRRRGRGSPRNRGTRRALRSSPARAAAAARNQCYVPVVACSRRYAELGPSAYASTGRAEDRSRSSSRACRVELRRIG